MAKQYKIHFTIRRMPESELVTCKSDGGRFQAAEKSVKLHTNTKYCMEFAIKPKLYFGRVHVFGETVTPDSMKNNESGGCTYTWFWTSTAAPVTKKGARQELVMEMESMDGCVLKLILQCKFYAPTEKSHSTWGDKVNFIEYDCKCLEGSTVIDVVKEAFR